VPVALSAQQLALLEAVREARRQGRAIPSLGLALSLEEAYAVQRALGEGRQVRGYKLGFVSEAKQRQMGIWEPIYGRVYADLLLTPPLSLGRFCQPKMEPELALVLARDLPPDSETDLARQAIGGFCLGLEVLDSVWQGYRFTLAEVVADNASAGALVADRALVGEEGLPEQLSLYHDGTLLCSGPIAALGDPAARLCWLAQRVGGLQAGQIVFLGAPAEAVPAQAGTVEVRGRHSLQVQLLP
jgi:2-keto-4-pentenoate hydratase